MVSGALCYDWLALSVLCRVMLCQRFFFSVQKCVVEFHSVFSSTFIVFSFGVVYVVPVSPFFSLFFFSLVCLCAFFFFFLSFLYKNVQHVVVSTSMIMIMIMMIIVIITIPADGERERQGPRAGSRVGVERRVRRGQEKAIGCLRASPVHVSLISVEKGNDENTDSMFSSKANLLKY